ncbi:hypothetical protein F0726_02101 [Acidithiobacillus caldus]|nr:hypothetical protein F0726_02101 [Acidithiobacillus caldus]
MLANQRRPGALFPGHGKGLRRLDIEGSSPYLLGS